MRNESTPHGHSDWKCKSEWRFESKFDSKLNTSVDPGENWCLNEDLNLDGNRRPNNKLDPNETFNLAIGAFDTNFLTARIAICNY